MEAPPATPTLSSQLSIPPPGPVSDQRRSELLLLARASRTAWILAELPSSSTSSSTADNPLTLASFLSSPNLTAPSSSSSLLPLFEPFNVDKSLDTVVYTELSKTLTPAQISALVNATSAIPFSSPERDPCVVFCGILSNPSVAESVKSMQHFVTQFHEATNSSLTAREAHLTKQKIAPFAVSQHQFDELAPTNAEAEAAATMLHTYLATTAMTLQQNPAFADITDIATSLETFLARKIFARAFALTADSDADATLSQKLAELSFMTFDHLDIRCLAITDSDSRDRTTSTDSTDSAASTRSNQPPSDLWAIPVALFRSVDSQRSPAEKLTVIMAASRAITAALQAASGEEMPGADDFLPALILAVVHANPPNFQSNLDFIQAFGSQRSLMSEAGYVLTHLYSAVAFLGGLEHGSLSIGKEEFEEGVRRGREAVKLREGRRKETKKVALVAPVKKTTEEVISEAVRGAGGGGVEVSARQVREMREAGKVGEGREMDAEFFRRLQITTAAAGERGVRGGAADGRGEGGGAAVLPPMIEKRNYKFLASSPSTFRLNDLPELLQDYKQLVKVVEVMRNERGALESGRARAELVARRKELDAKYSEVMRDSEGV